MKGEERKGTRPSSGERVSVGADPYSPSPTPSLLGGSNILPDFGSNIPQYFAQKNTIN